MLKAISLTPLATALLFGLSESLKMLSEEGLENVFYRHARLAGACRRGIER